MTDYIGQVVRAKVVGVVDDNYYKLLASIQTGNGADELCYVSYRGNPSSLRGDIVIRLDAPFSKLSGLSLDDRAITSHFITSSVPYDFEFANNKEIILYGVWGNRMKGEYNVPVIGKISNFFDPGLMRLVLHFAPYSNDIIPYQLFTGKKPEIIPVGNIRSALFRYLFKMGTKNFTRFPRVVTINESADLEERILTEFSRIMGWGYIKMEPQQ